MPPKGSYSSVHLVSNNATNITLDHGCEIRLTIVPLDVKNENFMFIIQGWYLVICCNCNCIPMNLCEKKNNLYVPKCSFVQFRNVMFYLKHSIILVFLVVGNS